MNVLMNYKMLKGAHQKNLKKDFYTYIHINTLVQRYIRNELSARLCTLILNSMPLYGLAISDQGSGDETVMVMTNIQLIHVGAYTIVLILSRILQKNWGAILIFTRNESAEQDSIR